MVLEQEVKGASPLRADRACAPDGAEPASQSQAKPLVPSAGKLWFAAAVLSKTGDLRCQTAWGNGSEDTTLGYLVGVCREKFPHHAIIYSQVSEVDVEREARSRQNTVYLAGLFLGAAAGILLLLLAQTVAQAIGLGAEHESAVAKPCAQPEV